MDRIAAGGFGATVGAVWIVAQGFVPEQLHPLAGAALLALFADLILGALMALLLRQYSARVGLRKTTIKFVQVALIYACAKAVAVGSHVWQVEGVAWCSIGGIAVGSMLQNLKRAEVDGYSMGPFGPILRRLPDWFAAGAKAGVDVLSPEKEEKS